MKTCTFHLFVFLLLGLFACEKSNLTEEPINSNVDSSQNATVDQYCDAIDTYVADNYPDATITSVEFEDGYQQDLYIVYLDTGHELHFDADDCTFLFSLDPPPCGCTTEWDPVCANGETYVNACLAVCAGISPDDLEPGECNCGCGNYYDPVCANGVTYDNMCIALCEGVDAADITSGACPTTCDFDAFVATNYPGVSIVSITSGYQDVNVGNAYYAVELDVGVTIYFGDLCDYYSICACDETMDLVCANGTTYLNSCEAECAGNDTADISDGPC